MAGIPTYAVSESESRNNGVVSPASSRSTDSSFRDKSFLSRMTNSTVGTNNMLAPDGLAEQYSVPLTALPKLHSQDQQDRDSRRDDPRLPSISIPIMIVWSKDRIHHQPHPQRYCKHQFRDLKFEREWPVRGIFISQFALH